MRPATQVLAEGIAKPILIGRREVFTRRLKHLNLRMTVGEDFDLVDPEDDPRFRKYWKLYHRLMERKGVSPDFAKSMGRTRNTVIAALMVRRGEADAMLCGTIGQHHHPLKHLVTIPGPAKRTRRPADLPAT